MMLTGSVLKRMMVESYKRIKKNVTYLNDINAFPVPDGDTGFNMHATIGKIIEELDKTDHNISIKEASNAIKKGAFLGAKGNSGVILSQFFVGFAKTIENIEEITTDKFAEALIEGSNKAYTAVMNPREGTILTVVRDTAEAALYKTKEGAQWTEVIEFCYEIAQKSTLETPNLLDVLKEAGVVDAGALGFVYLIQGWLWVLASTIAGPRVVKLNDQLTNQHNAIDVSHAVENLTYRYCTEAYISGNGHKERTIRESLVSYGDSLIVIGDGEEIKMHVHSNNPKQAIETLSSYGKIKAAKIDDMMAQTRALD